MEPLKDPMMDKATMDTMYTMDTMNNNKDKTEGGNDAANPTCVGWDGIPSGCVPSFPKNSCGEAPPRGCKQRG